MKGRAMQLIERRTTTQELLVQIQSSAKALIANADIQETEAGVNTEGTASKGSIPYNAGSIRPLQ